MFTSGAIHWLARALSLPIDIRDVCVFLAPLFSTFTAFAMYLFTKEVWDESAGLFAAAFMGIGQSCIVHWWCNIHWPCSAWIHFPLRCWLLWQRRHCHFRFNGTVVILFGYYEFQLLLQATYFLWLRSIKEGSMTWGALTAISYFYMVCDAL